MTPVSFFKQLQIPTFGNPIAMWGDMRRQAMTANEQRSAMPTRKPNILIVEDDEQIRRLLSAILEQSGYNVRRAHDGVAALEELRVEIPDILLSDLYMPRMTGFELLPV